MRRWPSAQLLWRRKALAGIPLRKPPKVTEDIRIVEVAGFDWSACGGTHVANTAQVGLIKITATERRGSELRVCSCAAAAPAPTTPACRRWRRGW